MYIETRQVSGEVEIALRGAWRAVNVEAVAREIEVLPLPTGGRGRLDAAALESLDSTGAWLVQLLQSRLAAAGIAAAWKSEPPEVVQFVSRILETQPPPAELPPLRRSWVAALGRLTLRSAANAMQALDLLGRTVTVIGSATVNIRRLRPAALARQIEEAGIEAIPIVALIAFLISIIVAYIGAEELKQFGGELFVVDLVSVSVLRELGVLLTAIIVAGRSGSAFAAEIGVMQLNDEVDALRAIGVNPVEVLVVPRVLGLVIALPLLTVVADAMGLAGGAALMWLSLDIPFNRFVIRVHEALSTTTFWAGLIKAPVFGCVIGMVGTFRGMQVRESSRELGRLTTVAVVESIVFVLMIDALFAIIYWRLDF
jgi:phospholipid/cholesterol/gamma-HCH transport system permease protein